jgi:TRAP-type C4-dicarboxylate transport system permease small subunit
MRFWLAVFSVVLSLAFSIVLTVLTFQFWHESWSNKWVSDTMWRARLWIPYASMPIGFGILTLQLVADFINLVTGRAPAFGFEPDKHA